MFTRKSIFRAKRQTCAAEVVLAVLTCRRSLLLLFNHSIINDNFKILWVCLYIKGWAFAVRLKSPKSMVVIPNYKQTAILSKSGKMIEVLLYQKEKDIFLLQ